MLSSVSTSAKDFLGNQLTPLSSTKDSLKLLTLKPSVCRLTISIIPSPTALPAPEIFAFIRKRRVATGKLNSPETCSVGALDVPTTHNQLITLTTRERNLAGFWRLLQRSIFPRGPEPLATIDFVAPSTVTAANDAPAPAETWFRHPADLGHPWFVVFMTHCISV
jgi:hypothetical protein